MTLRSLLPVFLSLGLGAWATAAEKGPLLRVGDRLRVTTHWSDSAVKGTLVSADEAGSPSPSRKGKPVGGRSARRRSHASG